MEAILASDRSARHFVSAMTIQIVLLPGLDGTTVLFEPLLAELAPEARAVEYPRTLPSDYESLLPLVLESLPRDEDFILIGWSFSGPLALMAAATRPRGLRGVVLCASFVQKPLAWVPSAARYCVRTWMLRFSGGIARSRLMLGRDRTPALEELLARALGDVPPAVLAARLRQVLRVDVREELRSCPVPILYLGADADLVVPQRNARVIQRERPDVRTQFIAGPHLALTCNPGAAASALREFSAHLALEN